MAAHLLLLWAAVGTWQADDPPDPPEDQVIMHVRLIPAAAPPVPVATAIAPVPRPERPAHARPLSRKLKAVPARIPPVPSPVDPVVARTSNDAAAAGASARQPTASSAPSPSAAPASRSLPPAPELAGMRDPNWEGAVLARLENFRRYPRVARTRRQQGVVFVQAMVDHQGAVLSARLRESSGVPSLDQEALDTFARAQPLPRPPASLPDPVALDVPVEFFLR